MAEVLYSPNGEPISENNPLHVQSIGSGGGGSSMRFLFGESNPTAEDGQPGDVFLNTNSGDIFSNDNGTWNLQGNLQGPQGEQGPQGPAGADGQDGAQGPPGEDGFGTEAQYNDIIARLEALEGGA